MCRARIKALSLFLISFPWFALKGQESSPSFAALSASAPSANPSEDILGNPGSGGPRRKLKVVLYPIIPAFTDYMFQIKTGFEDSPDGRDIQIEFQDLTVGYYDPTNKNFIEAAQADVYEIDSAFLNDFVSSAKIQQLPGRLFPKPGEFLANAQHAAQFDGKWYGVPHWACGNLLFFQKDDSALASVRTLSDLQKAIGTTHQPGSGLFIDLKGKSTLGEFYLMSLFDRYQTPSQVLIPLKVVSDSDLIPVAVSEVKPGVFGAQRRWRSYGA
jgi:thiamine pyridinylase